MKTALNTILAELPAENSEEEKRINESIVKLGPEAVYALTSMLMAPGTGDDSGARYALSGMTHYVNRPNYENERKFFSEMILEALKTHSDSEVKAFLIRRLQLAGKDEAVEPLGTYLYDERLCEPAVQALTAIGSGSCERVLIDALSGNSEKNQVTIIYALGDLQSKAAGYEIQKYLATDNDDIKMAVYYALANIGPLSLEAVISAELPAHSPYMRSKAVSYYLTYAKRLAETGLNSNSIAICRDLLAHYPDDVQIRIAVLDLLVINSGESALWGILAALESPDKEMRMAALELTHKIPGTNTTIELFNKMNSVRPDIEAEIRSTLKNRDKKYSIPVLEDAMLSWPDEEGFVALFNGKNLNGWKGLVGNPLTRSKMSSGDLADAQAKADEEMRAHWSAVDGILEFDGEGSHLCTEKDYRDFEMLVDWKIEPGGDSGIYLRGSPQVQIWDTAQWPEGSGGLYNNQNNPAKPLEVADNPVGEWNTLRIKMIGERVTVYLNDILTVDNVIMENYWDREQPIFPSGQIELQSHGSNLHFRNIKIREITSADIFAEEAAPELEEGFVSLFNGKDLTGWVGDTVGYVAEDGKIVVHPERSGGSGNLYTEDEYSDFILRFEFKLTSNANNGLGIRAPLQGDAAYVGMELQILDNTGDMYQTLEPWQYHGSVYGIVPAKRGYLKTVGSWNYEEVTVRGRHVTVMLNDVMIVDADIDEATKNGTIDGRDHPGLSRDKGHIGFLGHGSHVEFRNIRIKELK
ncbi:DUF1080 domain-containing protein [candidate division KSB1 bacterium]